MFYAVFRIFKIIQLFITLRVSLKFVSDFNLCFLKNLINHIVII